MSVLIWCSYFMVSLLGFQIFLVALRMLLQEKVDRDFNDKSFPLSFLKAILVLLSVLSLDQALKTAAHLHKEKHISARIFFLLVAFAPVSLAIPLVLIATLLMNFSGAWLGAIGLALWILSRFIPKLEKRSLIFVGWSVFTIGFDLTLKQNGLLMNAAIDQPWIFWLGNSSVLSCLFLFIAGLVITFLVRLPYVTVLVSISLLVAGIMSLPSALSLVFGEVILWLAWSASKDCSLADKKSGWVRVLIFSSVVLAFMICFPLFVDYLDLGFSREYSVLLRFDQFFVGLGLWVALDLIVSAAVFHYFSLNRAGQTK